MYSDTLNVGNTRLFNHIWVWLFRCDCQWLHL